jgi:hypothetical protein
MGRKKSTGEDLAEDVTTPEDPQIDPAAPSREPRPLERNGEPVRHGRHGSVVQLDPASLKGPNGEDPILALPAGGGRVVFRAVLADHAAELLACDDATGGPSRYRLATVAEAEAFIRGA